MTNILLYALIPLSFFAFIQTEVINWKSNGFNGRGGFFHDAANWDLLRVPGPSDDVFIQANGTYHVLINQPATVRSITLNKQVGCGCGKSTDTQQCNINLIIQAPLTLTTTLLANRWSFVYLVNSTLDGSAQFAPDSAFYGSGTITGDVSGTSFLLVPTTYRSTSTPFYPPWVNNIAKLTIGGNLLISLSTIVFDVSSNQTSTTMDSIYVNTSISASMTKVRLIFIGSTSASYNVPYKTLFSPLISGNFTVETLNLGKSYPVSPLECGSAGATNYLSSSTSTVTEKYNCPSDGYSFLLTPSTQSCCPTGWTGDGCNTPICPGEPDCSNHGTCIYNDVNTPPYCECDAGYSGTTCIVPTVCGEFDYCSNHGSCDTTTLKCVCDSGWTGANCSVAVCPGTPQCSNNGVCNTITGTPICDCNPGYTGTQCNALTPIGECNLNCSGHGTCNSGACECVGDWTGSGCNIAVCPGTETNCNGFGTCVAVNETVNQCECLPGWSGTNCTIATCPNDCSGRGECVVTGSTMRCDCSYPYFGDDCESDEIKLNSENSSKENVPIGIIAGVTGGILGLAVISAIIGFVLLKRKQKKRRAAMKKIISGGST